jgi:hypothetical protein
MTAPDTPMWLPSAEDPDHDARLAQKRNWEQSCWDRLQAAQQAYDSANREYNDAHGAWTAARDELSREEHSARAGGQP